MVTSRPLFPQIDVRGLISAQEQIVTVTPVVAQAQVETPALEAFCREYRLSEREAEVVATVLSGGTLDSLARMRGVTIDTVRKQLKSAMARLEVGSQKDIVRLFERFRFAG